MGLTDILTFLVFPLALSRVTTLIFRDQGVRKHETCADKYLPFWGQTGAPPMQSDQVY